MTADLYARALQAHSAGDLAGAERLYQSVLQAEPRHVPALTNLATVRLQLGRLEDGVLGLQQSLSIDPQQPTALVNLGLALKGLSRPEQAIDAFRRAARADPRNIDARVHLALLLEAAGRLGEAADAYGSAAALHPEPGALRHAQGLCLYRAGRPGEAVEPLRQAAALQPEAPSPLNDLGVALEESGRIEEALEAYGQALALKPDFPEALNNRALALGGLERAAEALADYDAALALQPDYGAAWFNRADALVALGRFEDALASIDRALALDQAHVEAWVRRGDILGYLRRLDEAGAAYARALALDPDHPAAGLHLAFPLLREGRYAEGLALYERRWKGPLKDAAVALPRPLWLGEAPIAGKTLLLHSEQGHGDTLMMLRYAPLLARSGARVILSVQAPLESLAAEVEGVAAVVPHGQPLPPYDLHIPMMSLPLAFGTRPDTIPAEPWLRVPAAARAGWSDRLGPRGRPRIGLVWSGSAAQKDNRWRSLPLERLAPLLNLDADFYALQTEIKPADRAVLEASPIHDLSGGLHTYADTAAAMEAMDLVITVCTSTANLAGGLGLRAFVLLGQVADWRWGLQPDASPWFPSLRLFRQKAIGDWEETVARVKAAAQEALASA